MPIYEFICNKCGDEFELVVFKDEKLSCPKCGTEDLTKKMSSFGFSVGYKFKSSATGSKGSCATCGSSSCSSCS